MTHPCEWPGCPFVSSRIVYPRIGYELRLCSKHTAQFRTLDWGEVSRMPMKLRPEARGSRDQSKRRKAA